MTMTTVQSPQFRMRIPNESCSSRCSSLKKLHFRINHSLMCGSLATAIKPKRHKKRKHATRNNNKKVKKSKQKNKKGVGQFYRRVHLVERARATPFTRPKRPRLEPQHPTFNVSSNVRRSNRVIIVESVNSEM